MIVRVSVCVRVCRSKRSDSGERTAIQSKLASNAFRVTRQRRDYQCVRSRSIVSPLGASGQTGHNSGKNLSDLAADIIDAGVITHRRTVAGIQPGISSSPFSGVDQHIIG